MVCGLHNQGGETLPKPLKVDFEIQFKHNQDSCFVATLCVSVVRTTHESVILGMTFQEADGACSIVLLVLFSKLYKFVALSTVTN